MHRISFNKKIPESIMQPSLCRAANIRTAGTLLYSITREVRASARQRHRGIQAVIWCGAGASAIQMHFLSIVAGGNATPTINNGMIFLIVLQFHCSPRFSCCLWHGVYVLFTAMRVGVSAQAKLWKRIYWKSFSSDWRTLIKRTTHSTACLRRMKCGTNDAV